MKTSWLHRIASLLTARVHSHLRRHKLESAYARMAKDRSREKRALEWAEATLRDVADEAR
jgi:hypothetical protein